MTIKLHCFGESGNAYKAALALELSGLDWEPVKVDFFGGQTRSADYRAQINNMGEAPVMIDGDLRLTQSGVIQDYVAEKAGKFGGRDATERREIMRWVLWDNHKLSGVAGMTRFLLNFLPEDKRPAEVIAFDPDRDIAVIRADEMRYGRPMSGPSTGAAATAVAWSPDVGLESFDTTITRLLRITVCLDWHNNKFIN